MIVLLNLVICFLYIGLSPCSIMDISQLSYKLYYLFTCYNYNYNRVYNYNVLSISIIGSGVALEITKLIGYRG